MDDQAIERLRSAAQRAFQGGPILVAYAFGSRVSGRPFPESDLDIGYYLCGYRRGETLPLVEEMGLADELSAAVGCEVDLRNLADAPLDLKGRVLEEGLGFFRERRGAVARNASRHAIPRPQGRVLRMMNYGRGSGSQGYDVVDADVASMLANFRRYVVVLGVSAVSKEAFETLIDQRQVSLRDCY
jgi:predicted nucleotidyltransferase